MYSNLFVCLFGMGTVFFGLICIVFLCYVLGTVLKRLDSHQNMADSLEETAAELPAAAQKPAKGREIEAAAAAAIAEELGVHIERIRIVSLKRI